MDRKWITPGWVTPSGLTWEVESDSNGNWKVKHSGAKGG